MKSEWNKDLDIPVEVLFKYLCRDYRREKAHCKELETEISRLKSELNVLKNNIPYISKMKQKIESLKAFSKEQGEAIKRRNDTIIELSDKIALLMARLEKYEEV